MNQKKYFLAKRIFDFMFALVLIIVLIPLFFILAILIIIDSGYPVFFTQIRIGKQGKAFKIYKFRTMTNDETHQDKGNIILMDDYRITRLGKYLRKYSLDELPQLINILRGEMSIIGPRPTLEYQVKKYNARQYKRLDVRPGITGWAQVNGRNSLIWAQKIELDVWYVENMTLWLDFKILCLTLFVLFQTKQVYVKDKNDEISKSGENTTKKG